MELMLVILSLIEVGKHHNPTWLFLYRSGCSIFDPAQTEE